MVYCGIDSRDLDPDAISRTVTRRDGEVWEDDAVALVLDTFDDDNNACGWNGSVFLPGRRDASPDTTARIG